MFFILQVSSTFSLLRQRKSSKKKDALTAKFCVPQNGRGDRTSVCGRVFADFCKRIIFIDIRRLLSEKIGVRIAKSFDAEAVK